MYDIFFLSYQERNRNIHWNLVRKAFPFANHVNGVQGIHAAHRACAEKSRTSHFFVIDADNELLDTDLSYRIPEYDRSYVHLWYARNPVNGLAYGWGGIKLFPRDLVLAMSDDTLDMTTAFPLKVVPVVKSITHFNQTPFDAWRSAFREAAKLATSRDPDAIERLSVWRTVATGPYAEDTLRGAEDGHAFALSCPNEMDLRKINDYDWLKIRFQSS